MLSQSKWFCEVFWNILYEIIVLWYVYWLIHLLFAWYVLLVKLFFLIIIIYIHYNHIQIIPYFSFKITKQYDTIENVLNIDINIQSFIIWFTINFMNRYRYIFNSKRHIYCLYRVFGSRQLIIVKGWYYICKFGIIKI